MPPPATDRRPRTADLLGALALLPFVAGAVLAWRPALAGLPDGAGPTRALVAYAATVIAFIGALHWGLAMRQARPAPNLLLWGVVPAIAAWIALLLPPARGLAIDAVLLVLCWLVDRGVYLREGVAHWLPLRAWLTAGAVVCCLIGAVGG